ncbi:MAG TPA: hypothetical protein VM491_01105, partial [Burkholderiaceae bacterium]|nr:hypothetical protein [Burkholderiaceae bacterium]
MIKRRHLGAGVACAVLIAAAGCDRPTPETAAESAAPRTAADSTAAPVTAAPPTATDRTTGVD